MIHLPSLTYIFSPFYNKIGLMGNFATEPKLFYHIVAEYAISEKSP
ncbi:hypothetical protein Llab_1112 [Lactococcus lactis]|nr:hypothetical protein Llab_1112 [Lactococcus lactis]